MNMFLAKNERQLGLCLRMLFDEGVNFDVQLEKTIKRKIVYYVIPNNVSDEAFLRLQDRYETLSL